MFVPLNAELPTLRPVNSQITPNDWKVLSRFWYPVAVEGDVKGAPLKGKILDVELVIYRVRGKIAVAYDLCPHRNVRISAGTIEDDRIVCAFHGLSYDAEGQCVKVPCFGREAKLPANYRLQTFRSEVRYGLVWACLDSASTEQVPVLPRAEEVGVERLSFAIPYDWPVGAPHQLENYLDIGHLSFVHEKTLGGDKNYALRIPRIERTKEGFILYATSHHSRADGKSGLINYTNTVQLPFIAYTVAAPEPGSEVSHAYQMYNIGVPISAHTCRVFWITILDQPTQSRESKPPMYGGDLIRDEDLVVLKELVRQDFPLDPKLQIHLPVDNIGNELRKCFRELGLGSRAT